MFTTLNVLYILESRYSSGVLFLICKFHMFWGDDEGRHVKIILEMFRENVQFGAMAYSSDGESCSWLMGLSKTPEENLGFELRADLRTFLIVWCEALESI